MTHICNDCKQRELCNEKFKEKTGLLCRNIFFRKQEEERFKKERSDYIEWLKKQ